MKNATTFVHRNFFTHTVRSGFYFDRMSLSLWSTCDNASRVKTSILNCVFWLKPSHGSKLNCIGVYFVTINCWKRKEFRRTDTFPLFTKHRVAGQPFKIPLMFNFILWNNFLIKKSPISFSDFGTVLTRTPKYWKNLIPDFLWSML